ncbi:MAG TPA: hypothetical protein VMM79_17905 [Longimicrobiales bacterium]|nr:hypothetical protein [Longimicrobiales bacterium]
MSLAISHPHVMVVEDDRDTREVVKLILLFDRMHVVSPTCRSSSFSAVADQMAFDKLQAFARMPKTFRTGTAASWSVFFAAPADRR